MKAIITRLSVVLLFILAAPAIGAETAADVLKDAIKLTNDHNAALDSAKDADTAKAAVEKLAALNKSAGEVKARADALPALKDEEKKEIEKTQGEAARTASEILLAAQAQLGKKKDENEKKAALQEGTKAFAATIGPVLEKLAGTNFVDNHDRLMVDAINLMNAMSSALESAKDETTAKAAAEKIKALQPRAQGFQARATGLGEPTPEQGQALMQKHMAGLMAGGMKLSTQAQRIQQDPKLSAILAEAMQSLQSLGN